MTRVKACRECRRTRRKCIEGDLDPRTSCLPCERRSVKCSKSSKPVDAQHLAPATPWVQRRETEQNTSTTLSSTDITECVNLYFRFIHDRPQTLFHEKTIWARLEHGTMPQCLLFAICATGCRFSPKTELQNCSTDLRMQSSRDFSTVLESITLSNVQTCVLLANLYAADSDNDLEALYFGIANRMAYVLRLHESHDDDSYIQREIRCRVWCTLYMADRWCPTGLGLPRQIAGCDHMLVFPTDEITFQSACESTADLPAYSRPGLWRYMITLVDILGPIQDLNQLLVRPTDDQYVEDQVDRLADRLQSWYETLPEHMVLNDDNLEFYRSHRQGGTFVALHLGYHHYSTLLFFQYLDSSSESTSQAHMYADRCRFHAFAFSKLLKTARAQDDCQVVYLTVAYMTLVSSSVLLHSLLFGEEAEIETAREQLVSNFEALIELKKYWPNINSVTQRLIIFQKACLQSARARTHKIDKWMIRYLLEHALPFEEKDSIPTDVQPTSPGEVLTRRNVMLDEVFAEMQE